MLLVMREEKQRKSQSRAQAKKQTVEAGEGQIG
jgi:hypothetical protein